MTGATKVYKGFTARSKLVEGVVEVADVVGLTLGPRGNTVCIDQSWGEPKITKDGVTVAKSIEYKDKFKNLGAKLLIHVAKKTDDTVGDGTTTASVLGKEIVVGAHKGVSAGLDGMSLRRGFEKARDAVDHYLTSIAKPVSSHEDIVNIGTISANGDSAIGEVIARAMKEVGKEGVISVEEGKSLEALDLEVVNGMSLDKGYLSPYFITDSEKMMVELDNPYILILDRKISTLQQILTVLEAVVQSSRPLLIIAEDVEGEALATLVYNKVRGQFKVCAVKAPGFGERRKEMLADIACVTGGQVITEDFGIKLENVTLDMLGSAKKVRVSKDVTTVVNGDGSAADVEARAAQIRSMIAAATSDYDKEKLQERLAKVAGGVAVIRIGGATEVEVKERKDRVDDALNATKAAVEQGIVCGGGCALLYASIYALNDLKGNTDDEDAGIKIVRNALSAPLRKIVDNAGLEGVVVAAKLAEEGNIEKIFNARTSQYVKAAEDGVIDPVKVVRIALSDAISIASVIVTTQAIVADDPEDKTEAPAVPGGGGMPGMGGMGF